MNTILMAIKANWKSWALAALKGAWTALKTAALPALIGAGVATVSGCSALQTPSSKTQTSAVYAFGLPAVVITHDNSQVADGRGADRNTAVAEGVRQVK